MINYSEKKFNLDQSPDRLEFIFEFYNIVPWIKSYSGQIQKKDPDGSMSRLNMKVQAAALPAIIGKYID